MLALAIFGGALAIVGELMRIGSRNAEAARDLTTAQLLCETKMAEISAGLVPPQTVTAAAIEESDVPNEWLYSVTVEPLDQEGMIAVSITVEHNPEMFARRVSFSLARWMIDPSTQLQDSSQEQSMTSSSTGGTRG